MRIYSNKNFRRQNNSGGYRGNYRNKIMKEVGVGLEKGNIKVTLEGMTGVVVIVGQGQDQEQILIETELGAISVENIIILQKIF